MKKLLLSFAFLFVIKIGTAQDAKVINPYLASFNKAYLQHPEIPKGMLEAVAFCNSRFTQITHSTVASESCEGIPNAYGVMGLTLNGEGYFNNNLVLVSQLSGYNQQEIINDPEKNILAYAEAFAAARIHLQIAGNSIEENLPVLSYLSELPQNTEGQIYALNIQLYGYLDFLSKPAYQMEYGFPNYNTDLEKVFGSDNLQVLSATSVTVTDESVISNTGHQFRSMRAAASADYAAALWNPAGSCNYSSRSGTAVTAVTVHTVQGSYAGCISWFQNCSAGVSAHYVARSSDGQITQMVLESAKAWHVGTHNPYTIGIEHEGYINNASWYTNAMYNGSAALVRDICASGYGINPLRCYYGPGCSGGHSTCSLGACTTIKGHQMFSGQTHTDPGVNWNWAKYYLLINNSPVITTVTTASGTFTDNGGATGNYTSDQRTLTLIQPAGATSITLNFSSFSTEAGWDYMFIYDGATTSAPLIGTYDGTTGPGNVTSSGGSLLIEFRSDCATVAAGWVANWTSNAVAPTPGDNTAPTTLVNTTGSWQTGNFTANFTDADNSGGSGLEKSYYQVIDFNGTEWRANANNGFFADNFDVAIHPDWTTSTGTWSINGAALYQSDASVNNTNIYASLNQTLSNRYLYNFYGKIDGTPPSGLTKRAGFHFACDNATLPNRGNSYFVFFRVEDALVQIYKVVNDVFGSPVVSIPLTTVAGQWYDYKIIYDRITGKISVYRDNTFITSWTDSSPYTNGNAISFRSGNAEFSINELKVYRSRNPASVAVTVGAAATNDIRFQNPNPTTFSGKVKSIVADSAGNLSSIFYKDLNIDWTAPAAVTAINDGLGSDLTYVNSLTTLSANWTPSSDVNSGIARYFYAIGTTPGATDVVNWTDNWYNDTATATGLSLINGQIYYYSVKAENGAGLQSTVFTSNGQMVQTSATGIEEAGVSNNITVYPNPVTNNSTIRYQLTKHSSVEISFMDVLGKEIVLYKNSDQSAGKHEVPFNSSNLASGVYFVKLRTDKDSKAIKVIVK
ncbi:MAG: N-acetylmuramyl-L-alanine amidase, negative regulator of AmpC, AmpD [Bacteroidota bacterium]|nr:N-acetylmuramyl-L-alanine amidase, negative regulator of AmpC, AmpD [Bacteroidota bacterium]